MSLRNVVTLSDVPVPLHLWYKDLARRRSQEARKHVGVCTVVVEALQDYKERHDNQPGPNAQAQEVGRANG